MKPNPKTFLLGALSLISYSSFSQNSKPNIVVFIVDDLGWNDTGVAMSGEKTLYNERYKTPNLERLAQEGVVMTNAHAQALSVPSRASLMTGQNSIRNGVTGDYTPTLNKAGTLEIEAGHPLDHRIALPRILKNAGYHTIHCGKFHLSEYESDAPSVADVGFDVNIAGSEHGAPGSFQPQDNYTNQGMIKQQGRNVMVGLEEYFGSELHLTEALTQVAIKEVRKSVEQDKPFFLYLSHFAVHTPVQPHTAHMSEYDLTAPGQTPSEAQYGSMITGVDASMGVLLDELKRLGIDDNTMILFLGDNGGRVLFRAKKTLYDDYQWNYPLRSGKASIYEGGLRIPFIAHFPQHFACGVRSDAPVMVEDIYTTVASMAGAEIPSNHAVDGLDLSTVFESGKTPPFINKRSMYFYLPYRFEGEQFNGPDFEGYGVSPSSAIIVGGWKLIYFHKDQSFELYNLEEDISEQNNLISSNTSLARKLCVELDNFLRANSAVNSIQLPQRIPTPWPMEVFDLTVGGL